MEKKFMKGCEAVAESAIRAGCRFFAGYPITPQNEIPEYLAMKLPEVDGIFVQGESEIASVNMVLGAASTGVRSMTSSSGLGICLKSEGIAYLAGSRVPAVIVNVMRGGPGLASIQPAQQDYFQATKALGAGGFRVKVFAPSTVQESADLTYRAFDEADKDRNPVMVLIDGSIGAIMEPVALPEFKTDLPSKDDWKVSGKAGREARAIRSFSSTDPRDQEAENIRADRMYQTWVPEAEELLVDDAEYVIVAYGSTARVAKSALYALREKNIKVGLIRPITLYPFPEDAVHKVSHVKKILCLEMSIPGQMVEDVKLAVDDKSKVAFFGRSGGVLISDEEIVDQIMALVEKECD